MLTKEEFKVIELFRKDLFKEYTIRGIMKKISKNSYNWTFKAIKKLNKEGLLNIEKKGNSSLCSVSLNAISITYLSFLEELNANFRNLPKKNINELIESIPLSYFTFIITGSYAKGSYAKNSDLDVLILVEDRTNTKKILTLITNKGELMIPRVHTYVFTKSEFIKMLLDKEVNYGKLVYKNRLILTGAENYYFILKEAIKNGFRG